MEKQARASKKQQELLAYIDQFLGEHGYSPSYREVMRALGYKSVSTVATHIDGLIAKGYLRKTEHSARSVEVVKTGVDSAAVAHEVWLGARFSQLLADASLGADDRKAVLRTGELLGVQTAAKK